MQWFSPEYMPSASTTQRVIKPTVFVLCWLPLVWLSIAAFTGQLGANPVETLLHETGIWALRLLWITLAITPLRKLTHWYSLIKLRRMLGLFSFLYASLHVLIYVWFEQFFDLDAMVLDVLDRPFIAAGLLAFILMVPLAVTSTNRMMRRLGRYWQRLHRFVYAIALLALLHFWWLAQAKVLWVEPAIYAGLLLILLGMRVRFIGRR